ncbi:hypothetical protein M885DRAFT_316318 [Pelagophyceae sp. CCMP2097]|nr:hypothetical protein M885DRAFT_316318 [Pelagophyceae sp. CCMP2097]
MLRRPGPSRTLRARPPPMGSRTRRTPPLYTAVWQRPFDPPRVSGAVARRCDALRSDALRGSARPRWMGVSTSAVGGASVRGHVVLRRRGGASTPQRSRAGRIRGSSRAAPSSSAACVATRSYTDWPIRRACQRHANPTHAPLARPRHSP